MRTQPAQLNYLRIAPRKARLIANLIKGLAVSEAEARLVISPQRAVKPILKLLRSAVSNAKHNQGMEAGQLFVKEIRVDEGPTLKRFMPRAMGRATPIHKKSSHISLILEESEKPKASRFKIVRREKLSKSKAAKMMKERAAEKEKTRHEEREPSKPVEKLGFMKRIFRRKAV